MPPVAVSASLFPGLVEEHDFVQPEHYKSTVEFQKECVETGWVLTQHFWNLIRGNNGLMRLIIGRGPVLQWRIKSEQVLLKTIVLIPCLKELQCWGFDNMDAIWAVLSAAPTLESLSIFCRKYQLPDPLPKANATLRILSFLSVRCDGMVMSINNLLDVLLLFPNLSNITLRKITPFVAQEQQQQQQQHLQLDGFEDMPLSTPSGNVQPRDPSTGSNLCELVVESILDYDALLKHLPDHIELTCAAAFGDSWPLALIECGPIFTTFRDTHPPEFAAEDDPVNELFVASHRLRVFDSIEQYILVDEMLRRPWACVGLEWLSCRIVGIDRLTDEEQAMVIQVMAPGYMEELNVEEVAAVEKFQRCRTQQHGVYDRLASLTRLKHLNLGCEIRGIFGAGGTYKVDGREYVSYAEPTFDTLELSLASGLDRLGTLKDLEMIGFECINHRIGRDELDWMAKSWPKLKLMYGLDKERLYHIEHDKERASLKDHFQQVRPDVVHDSQFEGN
ncbi:hypothetical protein BGZ92_000027 [Podila epicladia]|nr:hypothetical protein BGZ92_000027 [Podila epicladia]